MSFGLFDLFDCDCVCFCVCVVVGYIESSSVFVQILWPQLRQPLAKVSFVHFYLSYIVCISQSSSFASLCCVLCVVCCLLCVVLSISNAIFNASPYSVFVFVCSDLLAESRQASQAQHNALVSCISLLHPLHLALLQCPDPVCIVVGMN